MKENAAGATTCRACRSRPAFTRSTAMILALILLASAASACDRKLNDWTPSPPEKRASAAAAAVKALMTARYPIRRNDDNDDGAFTAQFWLLDVYKGAGVLARAMGVREKALSQMKDR